MRLSYKLKTFANKGKTVALDNLAEFWRGRVNHYIDLYWDLSDQQLKLSKPPKDIRGSGSKLENLASVKAWQIVKSAKKRKKKPIFKKTEFELDETLFSFGNFTTKEFDFWLKIYSGIKGKRIALPLKKHRRLNYWLKKGAVFQKTVKLKKVNGIWYAVVFLKPPAVVRKEEPKVIGVDIDYTNGAVDSTGKVWFNERWVELRKKTKWRQYPDSNNPLKQEFNRLAKELVNKYRCNLAFEKLNLKGKEGRSRVFRRNYKNLPYGHLAERVETLAELEGFQTVRVNPAWTSQTCPVCGYTDKKNRNNDVFQCQMCGFTGHADAIAAVNIAIRAGEKYGFQPVVAQVVAEGWRRQGIQPPLECHVALTPSQSKPPADFRRWNPLCHAYLVSYG